MYCVFMREKYPTTDCDLTMVQRTALVTKQWGLQSLAQRSYYQGLADAANEPQQQATASFSSFTIPAECADPRNNKRVKSMRQQAIEQTMTDMAEDGQWSSGTGLWSFKGPMKSSDVFSGLDKVVADKVGRLFDFDHREVPTRAEVMMPFKPCILAGGGLCSMQAITSKCSNATFNLYRLFYSRDVAKQKHLPILARFQVPGGENQYYWVGKFADRGGLAFLIGAEAKVVQDGGIDKQFFIVSAEPDGSPDVSTSNIIFLSILNKAAQRLHCRPIDVNDILVEAYRTKRSVHDVGYAVEIMETRFSDTLKLNMRGALPKRVKKQDEVVELPFGISINLKDLSCAGQQHLSGAPDRNDSSDEDVVLDARDEEEGDLMDSESADEIPDEGLVLEVADVMGSGVPAMRGQ